MIKAGSVSKGMFLLIKGEPCQVTDREFVNPGKGSAFVRMKLKNCRSGLVNRQVIKSQESVEDIELETKDVQYLYSDGTNLILMDTETFDQIPVPVEDMEGRAKFLKEGDVYQLLMWESTPMDIAIPTKMVFAVSQAEHAAKGDTVTGGTKTVTTETGFKVKVPLFIKETDRILVNTDTGEYVERVT